MMGARYRRIHGVYGAHCVITRNYTSSLRREGIFLAVPNDVRISASILRSIMCIRWSSYALRTLSRFPRISFPVNLRICKRYLDDFAINFEMLGSRIYADVSTRKDLTQRSSFPQSVIRRIWIEEGRE